MEQTVIIKVSDDVGAIKLFIDSEWSVSYATDSENVESKNIFSHRPSQANEFFPEIERCKFKLWLGAVHSRGSFAHNSLAESLFHPRH